MMILWGDDGGMGTPVIRGSKSRSQTGHKPCGKYLTPLMSVGGLLGCLESLIKISLILSVYCIRVLHCSHIDLAWRAVCGGLLSKYVRCLLMLVTKSCQETPNRFFVFLMRSINSDCIRNAVWVLPRRRSGGGLLCFWAASSCRFSLPLVSSHEYSYFVPHSFVWWVQAVTIGTSSYKVQGTSSSSLPRGVRMIFFTSFILSVSFLLFLHRSLLEVVV